MLEFDKTSHKKLKAWIFAWKFNCSTSLVLQSRAHVGPDEWSR